MTAEPTVNYGPPAAPVPDPSEVVALDDGVSTGRGEYVMVDPRRVEIGSNTRTEVHLDPHFSADIRDRGVRTPISVRRRASDGALVLRTGQRRLLAAQRHALPEVPAVIDPEPAPEIGDNYDDPDQEIERIIDQLGENQHRAAITDGDEVRAHQQLLDLGMNRAQIARRTHTPAKRVRQTTAIAASPTATEVMASYELDLEQLQVIAEFDGDPDAVDTLLAVAQNRPYQFEHTTQRLRDQRTQQAVLDAAVAELTEQGVVVVDRDDHDHATPLERLRPTADDPPGTVLQEQAHRSCPGHAVEVTVFAGWGQDPTARPTYLCLAPAEHGHTWLRDQPTPGTSGTAGAGGAPAGALGEQEQEAQREAKKAERRRVIANNKAWDSATTVRRDWVTALLARRSVPKDAARYVAAELGQGDHHLRRAMETGNQLACTLLGLEAPVGYYAGRPNPIAAAAATATGARPAQLSLAVVLAAFEDGVTRDAWRRPTGTDQRYFQRLQDWGYALSDVELLVLDPDRGTDLSQSGDPDSVDADADPEDLDRVDDSPGDRVRGDADVAETATVDNTVDNTADDVPARAEPGEPDGADLDDSEADSDADQAGS